MLILTFNDNEEKAVEKVLAALAGEIRFEVLQSFSSPMLSFSGLEIRQYQRRVLRNGKDVKLTYQTALRNVDQILGLEPPEQAQEKEQPKPER